MEISKTFSEVKTFITVEALHLKSNFVESEHVLLGMLCAEECNAVKVLKKLNVSIQDLRSSIEKAINPITNYKDSLSANGSNLDNSKYVKEIYNLSNNEATNDDAQVVGTEHLLLSILKFEDNLITKILNKYDINYSAVKLCLNFMKQEIYSKNISDLKLEIEKIQEVKMGFVSSQKYEEAGILREKEKKLWEQLEILQAKLKKKEDGVAMRDAFAGQFSDFLQSLSIFKNAAKKLFWRGSSLEENLTYFQKIIRDGTINNIKLEFFKFESKRIEFVTAYKEVNAQQKKLDSDLTNSKEVIDEYYLEEVAIPFYKLEDLGTTFSKYIELTEQLDELKASWIQELASKGINPYINDRKINKLKKCKIFIIDSNIWMDLGLNREFKIFIQFLNDLPALVKIPNEVLDEIEKKLKRKTGKFKQDEESRKLRLAKSRMEAFSREELLELTGDIDIDVKENAYADPILLKLLQLELRKGLRVAFISNDNHVLIKAREFIRRKGEDKGIGINLEEFQDLTGDSLFPLKL